MPHPFFENCQDELEELHKSKEKFDQSWVDKE